MSKKPEKVEKNYRIFRVDDSDKTRIIPKKVTMVRIHAEDNDDAFKQLKDYTKIANKQYKYYVEKWSPLVVIRDGKKHVYEDFMDEIEDTRNNKPIWKRIYDSVYIWCWRWFIDKPRNIFYYGIRNSVYLLKHKQQYCASWCIDDILLDTLKFNIPILKRNKNTLSWKMLNKAIAEHCGKKMTAAELDEYHRTHLQGYGKKIEDRAIELEQQMFDQLVDDIKAYQYYMGDYEYIDLNNKDLVETDKKLRGTLPLIKGSYDCYDYKKLNALTEKYWNRIWETVRTYGREFND